jgi:hypothetical protein
VCTWRSSRACSLTHPLDTFRHRVRMLFWLSMSSFAFPSRQPTLVDPERHLTLLGCRIAPLMVTSVGLVATLKQSSEGSIAYYTVLLVNTFASAICVAFATGRRAPIQLEHESTFVDHATQCGLVMPVGTCKRNRPGVSGLLFTGQIISSCLTDVRARALDPSLPLPLNCPRSSRIRPTSVCK